MKYNKEEKSILDALENEDMELSVPSKEEIESIKSAARSTFRKDRRITSSVTRVNGFIGIQKKALEMGIPYQTLISGIIHRYVEGDLKVTSNS